MATAIQSPSAPWLVEPNNEKQVNASIQGITANASKDVQWYQSKIKSLPPSTISFFETYVGIRGSEDVASHIYNVRDKAWAILPYPCIGLFRFLDFSIHLSPDYETVIRRVQEGATFLDLGCCFGQELRKLSSDSGVNSANLIGVDLEPEFLGLRYELFADAGRSKMTFIAGNIFAEDFLEQYRGKIDIIYLASFLHLFNEEQQKEIVRQLNRLLRPQAGSMVFGRNLGAVKGGRFKMESIGWDFDKAHEQDIQWNVTSSLSRYQSANWDEDRRQWQGDETKQMLFMAVRL
ncbi:hypothetical protein F5Y16DRAFT_409334 [Xylariaceae sp. FL0255]|nr:hypothetical protein F5Y16DRAFT_409334 [Xylariaceae sp. FL0255]